MDSKEISESGVDAREDMYGKKGGYSSGMFVRFRVIVIGVSVYPSKVFHEIENIYLDEGRGNDSSEFNIFGGLSSGLSSGLSGGLSGGFYNFIYAKNMFLGSVKFIEEKINSFLVESISVGSSIRNGDENKGGGGGDGKKFEYNNMEINIGKIINFCVGVPSVISVMSKKLEEDVESCGANKDFLLRKRYVIWRDRLRNNISKVANFGGIVSHKDLEDLNQRFSNLVDAVGKMAEEKDRGEVLSLDRRRHDRRMKDKAVDYEMRLYERRSIDRKAV